MVEVGRADALQPALLDRLTDHDPTRKVEGRDERVLSRAQLRASVLRDLTWPLQLDEPRQLDRPDGLSACRAVDAELRVSRRWPVIPSRASTFMRSSASSRRPSSGSSRGSSPTAEGQRIAASDPMSHHKRRLLRDLRRALAQPYPVDLLIKTT